MLNLAEIFSTFFFKCMLTLYCVVWSITSPSPPGAPAKKRTVKQWKQTEVKINTRSAPAPPRRSTMNSAAAPLSQFDFLVPWRFPMRQEMIGCCHRVAACATATSRAACAAAARKAWGAQRRPRCLLVCMVRRHLLPKMPAICNQLFILIISLVKGTPTAIASTSMFSDCAPPGVATILLQPSAICP